MLKDIIYNVMLSSLLVIFIANIMDLEPYIIKYKCIDNYFLEKDEDMIESIAWNIPDTLPLLKLNNKDYKIIDNYNIDNLIFLGL